MSKRILAVEDQEDNRRILRDMLTSADYENNRGSSASDPRRLRGDALFGKLTADETEKWGKVVKFAGIEAD
jgi:CheY-like chemotaxis protein